MKTVFRLYQTIFRNWSASFTAPAALVEDAAEVVGKLMFLSLIFLIFGLINHIEYMQRLLHMRMMRVQATTLMLL